MDNSFLNWLIRHWKLICLITLSSFIIIVATAMLLLSAIIKSSDAYKDALARVKARPDVEKILGSPVESVFFVSGNYSVVGPSGEAKLGIPISGPKGKGTLYVEATKSAGQWTFRKLIVEVDGSGKRIDLLANELNPML